MHIIIPIKQVPEISNVKMDEETGTMKRSGAESIINPLDLYAIESGLQLREEHGIGSKRKSYLEIVADPVELTLMSKTKGAFDPNGIMNPRQDI